VDEADGWVAAENSLMQEEEGADSLEVDDLEAYLPGIDKTGIAYALYEPDSGFADPVATTAAYGEAARRLGAAVYESTPVESIELANGRIRGVRARGELLRCESVVLAAGAWSAKLAADIGLDLPVEIYREQDAVFDTSPEPAIQHAVSSQVDRVYLRPAPEAGASCVLVGRGFPKEYERVDPDGYDESVDEAFESDVHERVSRRVPRLARMRAVAGRVGLYTVTPDWHPLLGAVDGYDGLFLATGGSGHCFKLGPAIGELVAADVLGRPPGYADVRSFSLARFAEGRPFRSTYGGNRA
jgi:glycine/D-amino acid oxidase-like deaminating enzyme